VEILQEQKKAKMKKKDKIRKETDQAIKKRQKKRANNEQIRRYAERKIQNISSHPTNQRNHDENRICAYNKRSVLLQAQL